MEEAADHVLDIICLWSGNTEAFYVLITRAGLSNLLLHWCFVFMINEDAKFMPNRGFIYYIKAKDEHTLSTLSQTPLYSLGY